MRSEGFHVHKKSTDTSSDRNRDLPICSTAQERLLDSSFSVRLFACISAAPIGIDNGGILWETVEKLIGCLKIGQEYRANYMKT